MAPRTKTTYDPERPTDEELGIGVEDEAPADAVAALIDDPRMAALLDAAVAARLAQMGVTSAPAPGSDALVAFTETIKHLITTQAQQQPGYIKPLDPDEVDRRAAGKVEMFALITDYQARYNQETSETRRIALSPTYLVGEKGFFECANALEFKEGQKIRTFLPPVEDFIPQNEPAELIHAAMMQWLGGSTPEIGAQVQAAMIAANAPPMITGAMQPARAVGPVEVVADAPTKPAPKKRRTMGTITPERQEVTTAERLGAPVGPAFHDAA